MKRPEQIRATATSATENKELKRELEEVRKQLGQQEAKHRQLMEEQSQRLQQLFRNQLEGCTNISQPQGFANRSGSEQGRQPRYGNCYKCGQPGHGYRYCPVGYAPQLQPEAENRVPPHTNHYVSGSRSAYLPAKIYGKDRWCLLDSGREVSVVPARCVPHDKLRPASQTVRAANGTDIPVIGETELSLETDGGVLTTPCLVSEHVDEILLGLNFLEENHCVWNFNQRSVDIRGKQLKLYAHKPTWGVRRIVLQETVELQPRSQQNLPAKTVYSNFSPSLSNWISQPIEIAPGVRLARTVVRDRPTDVHVNVVNTNDHTVVLPPDLPLGRLEEAHVEAPVAPSTSSPGTGVNDTRHLDSLLQGVDESVSNDIRRALKRLLERHSSVFSRSEYDLGCATAVKHRIDTGANRPFRQPLRRQPVHLLPMIDEQLQTMQQHGIIRPSQSEWASNLVIVKKKDGSLRFCVDYRQLNERTVKDTYPLPRIDDCLDTLGGSTWFSTMDLRSGYHQVAVDDRDAMKTTFVTRRGTFAFNVMPFGLCNSPATFQRLMDCTMAGLNYEICLLYLDDIIVFSRDLHTHLERLELIFERLRQANLKLKPSKCCLLQRKVEFLGYNVSAEGVETDEKKVESVVNWPVPSKLKEVRGFLGLCSYYRRFVKQFSEIAAPLHALQKKGCPFVWSGECQTAFETLKRKLTEAPVLALPRDQGMFILDTDASNHGIGAVLSQVQDGEEKVISYASRLYSNAEHRYCVTRKELLGVVFFLKHFRQYLLGRPFLVRTDHAALQWLRRTPEPIGQQGRWLEQLEEFDFTVQHRPGAKHSNADALSHRPCRQCGFCGEGNEIQTGVTVGAVELQETTAENDDANSNERANEPSLHELQLSDPDIGPVLRLKLQHVEAPDVTESVTESEQTKRLLSMYNQLELHSGVLYRRWTSKESRPEVLQVIVSAASRQAFIVQAHSGMTGGRLGVRRTIDQVQRRAFWFSWRKDVERFCR